VPAGLDFFICEGEGTTERGPCGENARWEVEKGVETGGVAATPPAVCLPGVGVAIVSTIMIELNRTK
jgi:hypothetical protein